MAPRRARHGWPAARTPSPTPAPTRRKLKSSEPGNCHLGVGGRGPQAGAGTRCEERAQKPGGSRGGGQPRVRGGALGRGWGGQCRPSRCTPPTAAAAPGPGQEAPARAGLPIVSRRAHTHPTAVHRPAPAPPKRPGPRGCARAAPSAPPTPPSRAPPLRPDLASRAARETLHSPEFLHVCGRGLRETKREGQQAGGVRSAAAPGGAGHSGHGRVRRQGAPRGWVSGKPGPRAPNPCPLRPRPGPRSPGLRGAPGRGRVTGEPAGAAALPGTELRPPGGRGGRPGDSGWHGPGRSRSRPKKGDPGRPR